MTGSAGFDLQHCYPFYTHCPFVSLSLGLCTSPINKNNNNKIEQWNISAHLKTISTSSCSLLLESEQFEQLFTKQQ